MKQFLVILMLFLGLSKVNAQTVAEIDWFITEWNVNLPSQGQGSSGPNTITFNLGGVSAYSNMQYRTTGGSWTPQIPQNGTNTITVGTDGKVEVRLFRINNFRMNPTDVDAYKLKEVKQWGNITWNTANRMFFRAINMDVTATDIFRINGGNMNGMFHGCTSLVGNASFNNWQISNVTGMNSLFHSASAFNAPIGNWNVSSVTDMNYMFYNASAFSQTLYQWNVANVTSMVSMFHYVCGMLYEYTNWNLEGKNTSSMFIAAGKCAKIPLPEDSPDKYFVTLWEGQEMRFYYSFERYQSDSMYILGTIQYQKEDTTNPNEWTNIDISEKSPNVQYQLIHTFPENGRYRVRVSKDLKIFRTSHQNLREVQQWGAVKWSSISFMGASNMDVTATDTPIFYLSVELDNMFQGCTSLVGNASFNNWDVRNVTSMRYMFAYSSFNQDISSWDVNNVRDFRQMFYYNNSFSHSVANWNVHSAAQHVGMFEFACRYNMDYILASPWISTSERPGTANPENPYGTGNCLSSSVTDNQWFITEWDTTIDGNENSGNDRIKILVSTTLYGNIQYQKVGTTTPDQWVTVENLNHPLSAQNYTTITFPSPGKYKVRMHGVLSFHSYVGDPNTNEAKKSEAYKLLKVEQWGTHKFISLRSMFYDAINMDVTATDTPNIGGSFADPVDATNMFYNTPSLVGNASFNNWDTKNITSMEAMFYKSSKFNQPIGNWNTRNVSSMESMFYDALEFNQPIGNWNTRGVSTMKQMFNGAIAFNQPLSWDTRNVNNMESMFNGAVVFNKSLNFNTRNVTTMAKMFYRALEFNQNLYWETPNLRNMQEMFYEAKKFNGSVSLLSTTMVTNMSRTFYRASEFNQYIGNWITGNVTTMQLMFFEAEKFNQPIGNWNTEKVQNMSSMFQRARAFNQPIGNWNTGKVTTMRLMFSEAGEFNQDIGNWNTSQVTNTEFMFFRAAKFNQYIGDWDISKVTNMRRMFYVASRYNQSMEKWNISNVVNFEDALSFTNLSPYNIDKTLAGWKTKPLSPNLPLSSYTGGEWSPSDQGGPRKLISSDGLTNIRYCNQENIDAMVAKGFEIQVTQKCGEIGLTYLESPNDMVASHKVLVGVKKTNGVDSNGKSLGAFEWLEEYDGIEDTSTDLGLTQRILEKVHSTSKGERDNLKEFPNNPSFTQKRYPLANLRNNSGAYNVQVIPQTEFVNGQDWELGKVVFDPVKNHFYQATNQGWERIDN